MQRLTRLLFLILFCSAIVSAQTHTEVTVEDNQTITGNKTFSGTTALNGLTTAANLSATITVLDGCQHVNAIQSFAAALAAASTPGCIAIDPGTYTVAVNSVVPSNVNLISESGGILSIANAVTLTINGIVIGSEQQIFTYVGSGSITIAGKPIIYCDWFPGADEGARCNAAYAAIGSAGSTLQIAPQPTCYSYSTPIVFGRSGVNPKFDLNGQCLNYTPTGGTSAAITGTVSESTNTVTVTSTLNPGVNNYVAVTLPDPTSQFNGVFLVASSSGSNFTYVNPISGISSFTIGTTAATAQNISSPAITLGWGPIAGYSSPWGGVFNGYIRNNNCVTTGGCGYATIGILNGSVAADSGTGQTGSFERLRIEGFGDGEVSNGSGINFAVNHINVSYMRNTIGFYSPVANEGINWQGGMCQQNGVCFDLTTPSMAKIEGMHQDSNIIMGTASAPGGTVSFSQAWFENLSGSGAITTATTSAISEIGNIATITTSANPCLVLIGQSAVIASTVVGGYNGTWNVTTGCNGTNTFSFYDTTSGLGASSGSTYTVCNGYTTHYYNGVSDLQIKGASAQDDCGTGSADYWFDIFGQVDANIHVGTAGRTTTAAGATLVNLQAGGGRIHFENASNATFTQLCFPNTTLICSVTNVSGGAATSFSVPKITLETSAANYVIAPPTGGGANTATFPNAGGIVPLTPNTVISTTSPTIAGAGCGGTVAAITAPNGTASFEVFTGTAPTTACTITMPTATTSWTCDANTVSATTTTNFYVKQTGAISTTSVVLTMFNDVAVAANFTASDTLRVKCMAN